MEVRITDRQRKLLLRAARNFDGAVACERSLGKQLVKKGLMFDSGQVYERQEWQKSVARLPIFVLTKKGVAVVEMLLAEKDS